MAKHSYADWLTKDEAAAALQVSTKTVEKFAADGDLHTAMVKNPETGATRVKYHPRDVEKLRKERLPDAKPFVLPKDRDGAGELPARRGPALLQERQTDRPPQVILNTLAEGMAYAAAQIVERQASTVPLHVRLFLTRTEAAHYSGLPKSEIIQRIAAGALPAMKTGRGWRIRRTDLEQLCARLDLYTDLPEVFDRQEKQPIGPDGNVARAVILQNPLDRAIGAERMGED